MLSGVLGFILGFSVCLVLYNNQTKKDLRDINDILRRMVLVGKGEEKEKK
jgi:hypothetical protein